MSRMKVTIKGIDKLKNDIRKAVKKLPSITAFEYREVILKNLEPSRKTGALYKSFIIKNRRLLSIIESDLPYAAIQNYGGRIRITDRMRKKMWVLYRQTNLAVYKAIAITKKSHVTIPAKNYLKYNKRQLERVVNAQFNKITRKI